MVNSKDAQSKLQNVLSAFLDQTKEIDEIRKGLKSLDTFAHQMAESAKNAQEVEAKIVARRMQPGLKSIRSALDRIDKIKVPAKKSLFSFVKSLFP